MSSSPANKKQKFQSGFSLIEIAIVIVIGGLLMALFSSSLQVSMQNTKLKVTQERLKIIDDTIKSYASINQRYPCVAALNAQDDSAAFGLELTPCTAAPNVGESFRTNAFGSTTDFIRIGAVPTKQLNLPSTYAYDAWGRKFYYVVKERDTNTTDFKKTTEGIRINDTSGTSVTAPAGQVSYLIYSTGSDRAGSFSGTGGNTPDTACITTNRDGENCDNDNIFRHTTITSTNEASNQYYDDLMIYEGIQVTGSIPSGAIMAFNRTSCPSGWNPMSDMAGRTIIGSGNYDQTAVPPSTGRSSTFTDFDYESGSSVPGAGFGGTATLMIPPGSGTEFDSMPPYRVFLYCEKD